ncbi:transcriptional regulator [Brasilonema octagenarum UFV-E1]|uniref:Transcriptional regulator n=2 Tax=Brasilonema TaxID=383614 RepID=A0A856MM22_9CYAN|nr:MULTISPECIES: GUN4 domain-containing protein [Brasilonema]NMF64407.1 transcriptional regulator [Brasilonema octagenarum UFV-OR1]QDL11140.1 transcriptional regulator [Brasilonema sennae CENA114]QDL17486.1 transcriptional regulator [Brasilonema octagenarum UFV-E1]
METDAQFQFDVFLCHNSEDKDAVIKIAEQLEENKIKPWLDIWELQPGFPWQRELEKQIDHIKSAAVFVGKSGIGPWQKNEIEAFLSEFNARQCPVIPVLLPDAPQEPSLARFLKGMTWVDFREQTRVYIPPMDRLIWGITGRKPVRVKVIPQSQAQNTPQNQRNDSSDDLRSEKGVDYTKLRDLLAARKWEEADYETYLVMLQAVDSQKNDYIREEELLNFPCTDLRTIDQLWVKYSNGHFGFSVQKEIYLSVGGKPGRYNEQALRKFGDRVGWEISVNSLGINKVTFDTTFDTTVSPGHLPCGMVCGVEFVIGLFSCIETCKL